MKHKNDNLVIAIVIIVAVVILSSGFGMMGFGGGYGMMGISNYGFGGMWIFGFFFMTLIFVALILFIFWLAKQLQRDNKKR